MERWNRSFQLIVHSKQVLTPVREIKNVFDTSDINTDDRPLRRSVHLSVLCSAIMQQFWISTTLKPDRYNKGTKKTIPSCLGRNGTELL
jgi:hypothetical protein